MILEGSMHFDQPDIFPDDPTFRLSRSGDNVSNQEKAGARVIIKVSGLIKIMLL